MKGSAAIEAVNRPLGRDGKAHQVCPECGSVLRPHRTRCVICGGPLKGNGTEDRSGFEREIKGGE